MRLNSHNGSTIALATLAVLVAACQSPPKKKLPDGFDVCTTPLDGDEGANGFSYLVQIDVGRMEESESDEEWASTESLDPTPQEEVDSSV